jgi:CRISPR-associated protein Cas2
MWMMVMFDLPTDTADERRKATKFRKFLLDNGFSMSQYSVYFRFTGTRENSQKYIKMVEDHNPGTGDVSILFFTDYQFGEIKHLYKKHPAEKLAEKPQQYTLF